MNDKLHQNGPANAGYSFPEAEDQAVLVALLEWYQEMGVDAAIGAAPVNWLDQGEVAPGAVVRNALRQRAQHAPVGADGAPAQARRAEPGQSARPPSGPAKPATAPASAEVSAQPQRRFNPGPPDKTVADAQALAAKVSNLAELRSALDTFDGCGLKATAKNTCVFRGAETARLMIIGEAPGRDEDLEGKPFVGRAGQLLDKMLAAIGIDETTAHITNVVYWRPPGNRTPTPLEAQICRPFLERQVAMVAPDIVMLLGAAAARNLFDTTDGIMRLRGKWKDMTMGGHTAKTIATLHPAYLLRTPAAKRLVWRDLLAVRQVLSETT